MEMKTKPVWFCLNVDAVGLQNLAAAAAVDDIFVAEACPIDHCSQAMRNGN